MRASSGAPDAGFARILLAPAAAPDGVRHVLVLEPLGVQLPPRPEPLPPAPATPREGRASEALGDAGRRAMIMPRGSRQLLLPANPVFIWLTLLLALAVEHAAARPPCRRCPTCWR